MITGGPARGWSPGSTRAARDPSPKAVSFYPVGPPRVCTGLTPTIHRKQSRNALDAYLRLSRWVSAVWRRPVPAVRTATARALRSPTSTTRRLARVTAV
jgi:hypothetical protein